jgi:hypothetical protein
MKKCLFAITLILVATLCPAIAEPTIQWGITISSGGTPPPAVRYEPLPPPRPSQIWVRGYWAWDGNDYRWVAVSGMDFVATINKSFTAVFVP